MSKGEWDELGTSYLTDVLSTTREQDRRERELEGKPGAYGTGSRGAAYCMTAATWHDTNSPDARYWRARG